MPKQKKMWDNILTVIMTLLSLLWIYPIVLFLLNSLKVEGSFTTSLERVKWSWIREMTTTIRKNTTAFA